MPEAATIEKPANRQAKPSELVRGRRVEYRGSWGRGIPQPGEIIGGPDFENEELVWDVRLDNGAIHWGYLDQFRICESAQ